MLKNFIKILLTIAIVSFVTVLSGCTDNTDKQNADKVDLKQERERLEEANRNLVLREKAMIDEYIKNSDKEFVETGTGLRYRIVSQGNDSLIKTGDVVTMEYEMRLLNGDLLYSSDNDGLKTFEVGHGGVESGLEEAVLYMHQGDEAEVIIPAYLAYGLIGDGNRIPPRGIIVYNLKIIDNQIN